MFPLKYWEPSDEQAGKDETPRRRKQFIAP